MTRRLALGLCLALFAGGAATAAPTYRIVDNIPGPDGGWDYVHVDPAHDRLLVAHGTAVTAVDLASRAVTPVFAPGLRLHDALPIAGGREVVVTDAGAGTVRFLDAVSGAAIAELKAGKAPDAVAVDEASGLVLVMDHVGGEVLLIDARTHAAVATIPVGGALEAAVADGAGRAFVNVEDKSEVAVLDLAARKVVARYRPQGCEGPTGLAYAKDDNLLIVACDGATALMDAATGKTLATLPTGGGADGVVFDPARRLAFVSAGDDGQLAVVDVRRQGARIAQMVKTEPGARTLGLDPRTGRVYLPVAARGPALAGGGRAPLTPGTFHILVVGP